MITLGVLCSGGLGFDTLVKIHKEYQINFILTDKKSIEIIQFSKEQKIPLFIGNPRNGKGYQFIKNIFVDVITSINYLFLIEKDIISHPKKLIFNIHGSLLPKYRGRTPHVWAIINGEKMAGITAHTIDEGCDTGKIISQIKVPIEYDDTGANMLKKYESLYFPLIQEILEKIEGDSLELIDQNDKEATFFEKRVPSDGIIDWNLPKEQIRDWIRAQAFPYPGAFTFLEGKKITIDKVSLVDIPVHKNYKNGEIISINPNIIVKTQNGTLKLSSFREEKVTFNIGKRFKNENRK
jgi:methionyl-tRNA formyltransferase